MKIDDLKPNIIVRGPIFPEPVQVIVAIPMGDAVKLVGKGLQTGQVHEPILNAEQLAVLTATPDKSLFDGDARRFRLGIEALRLALAYEYDPYFSLSIARHCICSSLSCCLACSTASLASIVLKPQAHITGIGSFIIFPFP